MKYKVREMIKNVIEENAVSFKETTSQVLLNKVGNMLSEKYVEISQQIFTEENAPPADASISKEAGEIASHQPGDLFGLTKQRQSATGDQIPYNPNDPFWSTPDGMAFMTAWNYLLRNDRNASRWNQSGGPWYMKSPSNLIHYLILRANEFGVVPPPWQYPIPDLRWGT